MPSQRCEDAAYAALRRQGYQFVKKDATAAVKPCMWCKRALTGGEACYKHRFYGIESHRCVQMTPTLRCNQQCIFCWRSFEHAVQEESECTPEEIVLRIPFLQKKCLGGYNSRINPKVTPERFREALAPKHVAISLSGEPTLYPRLPELISLCRNAGYTTFLVTNGTNPDILSRCTPFQTYVSLAAPDNLTYRLVCRPSGDFWEQIHESLGLLGKRRSAIRITLVKGQNDFSSEKYGAMIQESGPTFVEVKGYMYLGYSRNRLKMENMPDHEHVRTFASAVAGHCDYCIRDESPLSRVVCLERIS